MPYSVFDAALSYALLYQKHLVIASNIFDEESGGVDVKLLAYGDVETLVTRSVDRDVADTPSALPGAPLLTPSLSPHGWSNYDHGIC